MKQFWKDTILATVITLLLVLLLNTPAHAKIYEYIKGTPRVIDGDTVELAGQKIRLICVDTPESNYHNKTQYCLDNETDCGLLAKQALQTMIGKDEITCRYTKIDMYGRVLGECFKYYWGQITYKSEDSYNYALVEQGFAWYYKGGKECTTYKSAFDEAKKEGYGLFNEEVGGFKEPKLWRKTKSNN